MTWLESFWKTVQQFFVSMFDSVWNDFLSKIPEMPQKVFESDFVGAAMEKETDYESLLEEFLSDGLIDQETYDHILNVFRFGPLQGSFLFLMLYYSLISTYTEEKTYATSTDLRHKIYSEEHPTELNERDLATAAFVAPEETGNIRQMLLNMGIHPDKIDYLFLSMYRMYNDDIIRDLFLRGAIDSDKMYMRMRELGYTDTRTQEIIKTWEVIPPIQDLVRFAYRALFSEETRAKWPWMYEAPAGFTDWAKKQGLSEDWAEMYWAAHWVQPGLRETFEMLHRGKIAEDDVKYALEARGFSEYWQDKLLSISYAPYTRVDVRRMHDIGILTNEDLVRAYMDLGYDEEHALGMAKFTVRYNQQNNRQLTRTQIENAYETHLISKDDCKALLQEIEYPEDEADFLVEQLDWQKQKDYEDRIIKNIGDRYKNNLVDSMQARDRLNKLALDGQRIEILMDEWEIDRYEDQKLPSKSDLDKFFKNDIIDQDTYYLEMKKLGYGTNYINWYVQLSQLKKPKG